MQAAEFKSEHTQTNKQTNWMLIYGRQSQYDRNGRQALSGTD